MAFSDATVDHRFLTVDCGPNDDMVDCGRSKMILSAQDVKNLISLKVVRENFTTNLELGMTFDRQIVQSTMVSSQMTVILYSQLKAFVTGFKSFFMLLVYI